MSITHRHDLEPTAKATVDENEQHESKKWPLKVAAGALGLVALAGCGPRQIDAAPAGNPNPEARQTQVELSPTDKLLEEGDKISYEEFQKWPYAKRIAYACEKSKQVEPAYIDNLNRIGADHRPTHNYPISYLISPEEATDNQIISSINYKVQAAFVTNSVELGYDPEIGQKILECAVDNRAENTSPYLLDRSKTFATYRQNPGLNSGMSIERPLMKSTNPDDTAISPNYPEVKNGTPAPDGRLMRDISVELPAYNKTAFVDFVLVEYTVPDDPSNTIHKEWVAKI